LKMSSTMLSTPCAKLGIPSVTYAGGVAIPRKKFQEDDSSWNFAKMPFIHCNSNELFRGFVLYASDLLGLAKGDDSQNNTLTRYVKDLRWMFHKKENKVC
jgi:hypothetical protein